MNHVFGAALYVPANHPHLRSIINGEKLTEARTLIICLEDAIAPHEYLGAMNNVISVIQECKAPPLQTFYLRPKNIDCFQEVMAVSGASMCFSGAVLPKFDNDNLALWAKGVSQIELASDFSLMPTLETIQVFSVHAMQKLVASLSDSILTQYVSTLRIGGNDLLSLLKMRRPRGVTIYETPLRTVIANLATTFLPHGFDLSAPVFEYLDDIETMVQEVQMDINHGLTGKTAIHPQQIPIIEAQYGVTAQELESAHAILASDAAGVFRLHGAMCEPETHRNWAKKTVMLAEHYGVVNG